jgi:1-acyl-sn-glycerol-3-phosphate acyltransferase
MKTPADATRMWHTCHFLLNAVRPFFCSLRVEGAENVPRKGGVVLACNHPGGMDSFVLGHASPRQVYYMAKRELFNIHPVVTFLLHGIGAFPVNRGARDTAALKNGVNLLREGRLLGMFPEGTRNRGMPLRRGKSGAVRIALEADAPVVPVVVLGIPHLHEHWYNPFNRTQVSVRFGKPLRFPADKAEEVPEYTTEVMMAIARMLPPDLRGQYGENVSAPVSSASQPSAGTQTLDVDGANNNVKDIAPT